MTLKDLFDQAKVTDEEIREAEKGLQAYDQLTGPGEKYLFGALTKIIAEARTFKKMHSLVDKMIANEVFALGETSELMVLIVEMHSNRAMIKSAPPK